MSEDLFVQCCAPTLAGIKTGSLFTFAYESRQAMLEDVRSLNRTLAPHGLRILPLRFSKGRALLYLFRPAGLRRDLCDKTAIEILNEAGYGGLGLEQCIQRLKKRLCESKDFPHEIGLFLGYPPSDVQAFINQPCTGVKYVGCWKSYSNPDECKRLTDSYNKCMEAWRKKMSMGFSLEQLLVSLAA